MRFSVAFMLLIGAVVLFNAIPATAQAPPPVLTEWCAAQQGTYFFRRSVIGAAIQRAKI